MAEINILYRFKLTPIMGLALKLFILLLLSLAIIWLAGCSSTTSKRYRQANDGYPTHPIDLSQIKDAVPRVEPLAKTGNPASYQVFNRTYHVLLTAKNYHEKGYASFYGTKFHGYATSSGEPYDMYQMTAAHKTLPLPTYVRVTNLNNHRHVIVRVNDRGPFVANRVIDLSYAAAYKLGMLPKGTAPVLIEAIDPRQTKTVAQHTDNFSAAAALHNRSSSSHSSGSLVSRSVTLTQGNYLQVAAFQNLNNAQQLAQNLHQQNLALPYHLIQRDHLYRIWLGPFANYQEMSQAKQQLMDLGYVDFLTIRYSH